MRAARLLPALVAVLAAAPAAAHPHVWIVGQAGFRLEGGLVVAVDVALRFDELLSASLIAEFDRDRDGRFDPAETGRLEREAFDGLAELDWLGRLRVGGQKSQLGPPRGFRADLEQGVVTFRFARPLASPADPRRGAVALTLADPSWYVDVVLDPAAPASLDGEVPEGCGLAFEPDTSVANLVAPVPPVAAIVLCERSS